ncbi:hypothetical protein ES702_05929 [subsurface metagenome]
MKRHDWVIRNAECSVEPFDRLADDDFGPRWYAGTYLHLTYLSLKAYPSLTT